MAEPLMLRRSPLDRRLPVGMDATVGLREVRGRALVELRVANGPDGSGVDGGAVASVLGVDLPAAGRIANGAGDQLAVWLGPGWWLLDAPEAASSGSAELESALVQRLRGVGLVSAVEVSAGFCILELVGPCAPDVLAHGCSIDLHPRAFRPDHTARTMLAKAQVVLAQVGSPANVSAPTYRIWVRTSFARYLVAWLVDAATEYLA